MIAESYKLQLLKEAKQLDLFLGSSSDFEKLIIEITDDHLDMAILTLIKNLGILTKQQAIPKINQKQEKMIETLYKYLGATQVDSLYEKLKATSNVSLDELMCQLDVLVGLDNVKEQVHNLMNFNQVQMLREKMGLKKSTKTLHMAFLGNPGTAKTTVARIIGKMYKQIGLLSKGHFIEASRTDLIAEYQGQTAIKVKRLINRAKGGVLFIDEAYSITENENSDSYGRECLTELTKALEDYRDDLVVIVAGYPKLMDIFLESNPGLKSRFNTFILFPDYTVEQLIQIFEYICNQNDYSIESQAILEIRGIFQDKLEERNPNFSNGRFVRNFFDDVTMNQANRLLNSKEDITFDSLKLLKVEDMKG